MEACREELRELEALYPGKFDSKTEETKHQEPVKKVEKESNEAKELSPKKVEAEEVQAPVQKQEEEAKKEEEQKSNPYDLGITPEAFSDLDEAAKTEKLREALRLYDELEQKIAELDQQIEECTNVRICQRDCCSSLFSL